jgi:hypothetical protein
MEPVFLGARAGGAQARLLDSDYDTFGSGNFESANLLSANLARRDINRQGFGSSKAVLSVKSD